MGAEFVLGVIGMALDLVHDRLDGRVFHHLVHKLRREIGDADRFDFALTDHLLQIQPRFLDVAIRLMEQEEVQVWRIQSF